MLWRRRKKEMYILVKFHKIYKKIKKIKMNKSIRRKDKFHNNRDEWKNYVKK